MAGYYRCPAHGRFPISDLFKNLDARALFAMARELDSVYCPKCGRDSLKCKKRRTHSNG